MHCLLISALVVWLVVAENTTAGDIPLPISAASAEAQQKREEREILLEKKAAKGKGPNEGKETGEDDAGGIGKNYLLLLSLVGILPIIVLGAQQSKKYGPAPENPLNPWRRSAPRIHNWMSTPPRVPRHQGVSTTPRGPHRQRRGSGEVMTLNPWALPPISPGQRTPSLGLDTSNLEDSVFLDMDRLGEMFRRDGTPSPHTDQAFPEMYEQYVTVERSPGPSRHQKRRSSSRAPFNPLVFQEPGSTPFPLSLEFSPSDYENIQPFAPYPHSSETSDVSDVFGEPTTPFPLSLEFSPSDYENLQPFNPHRYRSELLSDVFDEPTSPFPLSLEFSPSDYENLQPYAPHPHSSEVSDDPFEGQSESPASSLPGYSPGSGDTSGSSGSLLEDPFVSQNHTFIGQSTSESPSNSHSSGSPTTSRSTAQGRRRSTNPNNNRHNLSMSNRKSNSTQKKHTNTRHNTLDSSFAPRMDSATVDPWALNRKKRANRSDAVRDGRREGRTAALKFFKYRHDQPVHKLNVKSYCRLKEEKKEKRKKRG